MSKLSSDAVQDAVTTILRIAQNGDKASDPKSKPRSTPSKPKPSHKHKKRGFLETIELQIALKNYDPNKDKRFSGVLVLPHIPRPKFSVCILGNQKDIDEAKKINVDAMSSDDLTKLKKDKKKVKDLANKYHSFLASASIIRNIPRLLGPGLNKAGKFPSVLNATDSVKTKVDEQKATVKFQLKSKRALCLALAVANVGMKEADILANINLAVNFLVSLLPKNWGQVKRLYLKSTMGPPQQIFGF